MYTNEYYSFYVDIIEHLFIEIILYNIRMLNWSTMACHLLKNVFKLN